MLETTRLLAILLVLGVAAPAAAQSGGTTGQPPPASSSEEEDEEPSPEPGGGLDAPAQPAPTQRPEETRPADQDAQELDEEPAEPETQDEEPTPPGPENAILADLSLGVIGGAYEHIFANAISIQLAAQFYAPWYVNEGGTYGAGGELRLSWFLAAQGFEGTYIAVGFRAAYITHDDDVGFRDGYALAGSLTFGYGWLFDSFYLRLGLGGRYETGNMTEIDGQATEDYGLPFLAVDINLGWAG
ncbi:MAG: hypothetical protein AB7S26_29995 [Sandaracinaceae bacterium]